MTPETSTVCHGCGTTITEALVERDKDGRCIGPLCIQCRYHDVRPAAPHNSEFGDDGKRVRAGLQEGHYLGEFEAHPLWYGRTTNPDNFEAIADGLELLRFGLLV